MCIDGSNGLEPLSKIHEKVVVYGWRKSNADSQKDRGFHSRPTIRLHPELQEILRHWPRSHIATLTTVFGKSFSIAGFGNTMADAIRNAGLPSRCVPHGLRKAAARQLAEVGCSEKQIAAVTGHTTLKDVARYTRTANQERLAADAVDMLAEQKTVKISQTINEGLGNRKKS